MLVDTSRLPLMANRPLASFTRLKVTLSLFGSEPLIVASVSPAAEDCETASVLKKRSFGGRLPEPSIVTATIPVAVAPAELVSV